jgi:hypothetical protein
MLLIEIAGSLQVRESDNYGKFFIRKVARVDLSKASEEAFAKWPKFHPRNYFGMLYFDQGFTPDSNALQWNIWLPLKRDNEDWSYAGTKYFEQTKKKKLPIAVSDRDLNKWLEAVRRLGVLVESES